MHAVFSDVVLGVQRLGEGKGYWQISIPDGDLSRARMTGEIFSVVRAREHLVDLARQGFAGVLCLTAIDRSTTSKRLVVEAYDTRTGGRVGVWVALRDSVFGNPKAIGVPTPSDPPPLFT
jgi:hypothetical protein